MREITMILLAVLLASGGRGAFADVKTVEADSVYVLGDNDSRVDARRIAVQEAKRKALELAGTYVESLTEVKNYQLSRDEIKAYTAGIVETEIIADETRGTVQHPEVYVRVRCRIDTDVLLAQIDRYRENEDLQEQLEASSRENDRLRKERDSLVKQLATRQDKAKAEATRRKLDAVLAKEETNEETNRVWRTLSQKLDDGEKGQEIAQAELDDSLPVLKRALSVNPKNLRARHLLAALYQNKGDYDSAERELRSAVRRNPSNPAAHMKLGIFLKARGNPKEALKEFHFVERLRPQYPAMLFYTGMTLKDMNRCGPSIQYLQRFLKATRANRFSKNREQAVQAIEDCGGTRGGHQKRVRYRE